MNTAERTFTTEQEKFWAGEFGDGYVGRNEANPETLAGNLFFFTKALRQLTPAPTSIVEFGANIGLNLRALRRLYPDAKQTAVEINGSAVERLRRDEIADCVVHESILNYTVDQPHDLALIKGVMIHLDPAALPGVYRKLAEASSRYVLIAEYYNRRPEEVPYRGHRGRLFRRDFGGEFMDTCPEFSLVDYGFSYHRDSRERQDDLTWFLFRRTD